MAEKCLEKIKDVATIQDRLKQVFDALGITIYQIAKELGENPSKFYNILNDTLYLLLISLLIFSV